MLQKGDLERLLIEQMPAWQDSLKGEEAETWLKREEIDEKTYFNLARQILLIVAEQIKEDSTGDDRAAALMAGFQLAFFIGWEAAKQYAPKRDMSQL